MYQHFLKAKNQVNRDKLEGVRYRDHLRKIQEDLNVDDDEFRKILNQKNKNDHDLFFMVSVLVPPIAVLICYIVSQLCGN